MNPGHDVRSVAQHFQIYGDFISAEPYGSGHINDTYCVAFAQAGTRVRYIFQRINHLVFKNPVALMDNIARVTRHLAMKAEQTPDQSRRALTVISTHEGQPVHQDENGNYWRAYLFIELACTYDAVQTPAQAFEAAKAFGRFQCLLADLPAPRLHDTIPDFHHTPERFSALEKAI